jgi:hypothetical protein
MHVAHVPQPDVDQSGAVAIECRLDAAATVMADDHDVFDLEDIDGELDHRQAVEIGVHDDVGDVAVDEQLARQQTDDLVGRHARIRAADPQVLRCLQRDSLRKYSESISCMRLDQARLKSNRWKRFSLATSSSDQFSDRGRETSCLRSASGSRPAFP